MRQIRELLRLHFEEGHSQRLIARALGVVRCTVERVLKRFASSGLGWPPDPSMTDEELERRLYSRLAHQGFAKSCARPYYAQIATQLSRKGVTRRLLWTEYRDQHADGGLPSAGTLASHERNIHTLVHRRIIARICVFGTALLPRSASCRNNFRALQSNARHSHRRAARRCWLRFSTAGRPVRRVCHPGQTGYAVDVREQR